MTNADRGYSVHPNPVWRERANFIINARLPEEGRFEQLWCRRLTESTFEVCCIPFFLYDVALGDIVETESTSEGRFVFRGVRQRSGRFVFRVHFFDSSRDSRRAVEQWTIGAGGLIEWATPTLLAIDADSPARASRIGEWLQAESRVGQMIYETGWL
ncbi:MULTISPECIES: DUF4265 domain-containing protein [Microbacterium]|uniref:DUF4265 domain-containing protein n=1 Tax=Microbacterium TaxID=33882 RepID=UPI0007688945|nr:MULTISPECIES: DUF4265 domain-containing protein [Microbacterium]KXC05758.1 hypothetical protein MhomT_09150 [Microbacterium hominis]QOC24855.1 DUF4265 domain-containing protein [Microbacterium hominis]QOC28908.1 DUF4265 domain-containing protein [Microbacterium hominis]QYF98893.1 DUF4265 domain-containing protein [Microbacterium sp. PAMC21962]